MADNCDYLEMSVSVAILTKNRIILYVIDYNKLLFARLKKWSPRNQLLFKAHGHVHM